LAWQLWERWISEIVADFWSVSRVGVSSTLGLIGVVSLPRAFVFRLNADDPHPFAWIRVKLSCAFGDALYPNPQWQQLAAVWESMYPARGLRPDLTNVVIALQNTMPDLVRAIVGHRPATLRGQTLGEVVRMPGRTPGRLLAYYRRWAAKPSGLRTASPTLAFAVLGQARARGLLTPEKESRLLGNLITYWALRSTLDVNAAMAQLPGGGAGAAWTRLPGWPGAADIRGTALQRRSRTAIPARQPVALIRPHRAKASPARMAGRPLAYGPRAGLVMSAAPAPIRTPASVRPTRAGAHGAKVRTLPRQ
jgi:hypothetical protein